MSNIGFVNKLNLETQNLRRDTGILRVSAGLGRGSGGARVVFTNQSDKCYQKRGHSSSDRPSMSQRGSPPRSMFSSHVSVNL